MLGSTTPVSALIQWCRAIHHGFDIGLSPVRVFRQQASSGPSVLRPVASRVADRLETGSSLADAFKPEADRFPNLFMELIAVGEQSGRLPDIFAELEDYFETVKSTRQTFLRLLAWPVIQYVGAILVVTALLMILGALGSKVDPLGLGLTGVKGGLLFLTGMSAFTAALVGGILYVAGHPELRAKLEGQALGIPALGGCLRALALNRFSLAYYMTAEAGLRADRCLRMSLRATSNRAYSRNAEAASKAARKGEDVPSILGGYGPHLFPDEFMQSVHVGEESGRLAEVMKKQADYYRKEAARKMKTIAYVVSGGVYAMIGIMIIVMIFKIFTAAYLNPMNDAFRAVDNPNEWLRGDR